MNRHLRWVLLAALLAPARTHADAGPEAEPPKKERVDRFGDPLPDGARARLGTVRLRHPGLRAAAFAPDGETVASIGADGFVRLWDADTGRETAALDAGPGAHRQVWFAPDGESVVWATTAGELFAWRPGDDPPRLCAATPTRTGIAGLAWSPDGSWLAAAGMDRSVWVWEWPSGKQRHRLTGCAKPVKAVAVSPDGAAVLAAEAGTVVRRWDADTGKPLPPLELPLPPGERVQGPSAVAFSPDGGRLAIGRPRGGFLLWDWASGAPPREPAAAGTAPPFREFAFSPDGRLVAAGAGGTYLVHDAASGRELCRIDAGPFGVGTIALSAGARRLLLAAAPGGSAVRLWDVPGGEELLRGEPAAPVRHVAFLGDGRTVVTATAGGALRAWDATTGRPAAGCLAPTADFVGMGPAADGKGVWLVDSRGRRAVWEPGEEFPPLPADRARRVLCAVSSDGTKGVAKDAAKLQLFDLATGEVLRSFPFWGGRIAPAALTPGGERLAAWELYRTALVWDAETGAEQFSLRIPAPRGSATTPPAPNSIALSPDGRTLVTIDSPATTLTSRRVPGALPRTTASYDGLVRGWEVAGGGERFRVELKGVHITAAAFTPDGAAVLLGGERGEVFAYEIWTGSLAQRSGAPPAPPAGGPARGGAVRCVAVAPDGGTVVTGGDDCTALVWDAHRLYHPLAKRGRGALAEADRDACWADLAAEDAARAFAAARKLAAAGDGAVELIRARLAEEKETPEERTARLIGLLDDPRFAVREEAAARLAALGKQAHPALREALAAHPSAEARRRIESLLKRKGEATDRTLLRMLRAVEVLERIGTAAAREQLAELAGGAGAAERTREAKAALRRLATGQPPGPSPQ